MENKITNQTGDLIMETHKCYNGNNEQTGTFKDCSLCQGMIKWLNNIPKDLIREVA